MSNLRLNVTLVETDAGTTPGIYHEVEIDALNLDHSDIHGSLLANLAAYGDDARHAAVQLTGKPEYRFFPLSFDLVGAAARSYSVEGTYSNDGGLWGDNVGGVNASEAEFQAAWMMYDNVVGGLESLIEPGRTFEDYMARIARGVSMQTINSVTPTVPTREEVLRSLEALHADAVAAGMEWESLAAAKTVIDAERAALAQTDEIGYLEEDAASPAP